MPTLESRSGTVLNALFTILNGARYRRLMLGIVLLAASAAAQPEDSPRRPSIAQATATVRIVAGVRVTRDETPQEAIVRKTEIRSPDGSVRLARLVEFP